MKSVVLKNGEVIKIREAGKDDAASLLAFLDTVCAETDNLTFGPGEMSLTVEQEIAFLEGMAEKTGAIFLAALDEQDELVGTIHFVAGTLPRTEHAGEFGMSVLKAHWGKGLGSALMDALLEWVRERKSIRKVNLKVRADNQNAIHLYKKKGFVEEGRITREYLIRGEFHDILCMGLIIDH
ncbi:MAG: GNAT family protein [Bacillota bacterium]|nr:GNAT family protein [Bacillota bacterium]MDW7678342.1 GNAT family protein [Bacillota bacterium]